MEKLRSLPVRKPDPREVAYENARRIILQGAEAIEQNATAVKPVPLNATSIIYETGTSYVAALSSPETYLAFLQNGGKPNNSIYSHSPRDICGLVQTHGVEGLQGYISSGQKLPEPHDVVGESRIAMYPRTMQMLIIDPALPASIDTPQSRVAIFDAYIAASGKFEPSERLLQALDAKWVPEELRERFNVAVMPISKLREMVTAQREEKIAEIARVAEMDRGSGRPVGGIRGAGMAPAPGG
jgi:hypothetical protein